MHLKLFLLITFWCLTLWCGACIATPLAAQDSTSALVGLDNAAEISLLKQAYRTMAKADHDYAGHRVKAMNAIEGACDLLGEDIRRSGKGKERQVVSDDELRSAQTICEHVRDQAAERNQKKVVEHLEHAIKEISIALTIK